MDSSKNKTLLKGLRKTFAPSSEPSIQDDIAASEEVNTAGQNRAQNIFKSIKQKLRFRKAKLTCKTKKVSSVDTVSWSGSFASNGQEEVSFSVIVNDTPPAVPPRPSFTFEEGQYVDIPRTLPERLVSSQNNCNKRQNDDTVIQPRNMESPQKSFRDAIANLSKYGWYWGPLSRNGAEEKLESQLDGTFLVRNSYSNNYIFTLSFRCYGLTMHARIDYKKGVYTVMDQDGFSSIGSLIEEAVKKSEHGIYCYSRTSICLPSLAVRLNRPLSRHCQMKDLQYLCRFVIRNYISVDNIKNLPVPQTIQNYLLQAQF